MVSSGPRRTGHTEDELGLLLREPIGHAKVVRYFHAGKCEIQEDVEVDRTDIVVLGIKLLTLRQLSSTGRLGSRTCIRRVVPILKLPVR